MEPHKKSTVMRQIYGIDLSKEKFDVNFLDSGNKAKSIVVTNNLKGIADFMETLPKDAILCVEHTGVYGELLTFVSCCMNIPISQSSGYEIKHSLGLQKGKTDKVDAKRIREYGERFYDKLRFVTYPDETLKELRELYNLRAQLVKERKMLITQDKGKTYMVFNSIVAHEIFKGVAQSLNNAIKDLDSEIKSLIMSNQELMSNYKIITGIRGIGHITTCDLIVKTGNFKQIYTARKAASYAGVCPFPNSSGKMVKKSKVSKMADKELKSLLFLCSKAAVMSNPEYKLYYTRKRLEGKPYYLIMNNIANKLLRTIYSIVGSGQEYSIGHISMNPREEKKVA